MRAPILLFALLTLAGCTAASDPMIANREGKPVAVDPYFEEDLGVYTLGYPARKGDPAPAPLTMPIPSNVTRVRVGVEVWRNFSWVGFVKWDLGEREDFGLLVKAEDGSKVVCYKFSPSYQSPGPNSPALSDWDERFVLHAPAKGNYTLSVSGWGDGYARMDLASVGAGVETNHERGHSFGRADSRERC